MNKLCNVLIRNISEYLNVIDILNFELSVKRRGATPVAVVGELARNWEPCALYTRTPQDFYGNAD